MKTKLIALSIFVATAATVTFIPTLQSASANQPPVSFIPPVEVTQAAQQDHPKIEVVFVLDTTGSMSGLINAAKEKIWSIASTMASAQNDPNIKMGLVAYRDRGDAYITKTTNLSSDLDSVYATLMDFKAGGGGDTPESVNQGLYDAVNNITWSTDQDTYKVIFLVGDAPAHMDYQDDVKYPETIKLAKQKGILVNAIQAGKSHDTMQTWQTIAQLGQGDFFQVEQTGNAVAISTPFDKKMAELSAELDATRLYYGRGEVKAQQLRKQAATAKLHDKASDESRARRATFNSSKSGEKNFLGESELVDAISSGRVELSSIETDALPEAIQSMSVPQQRQLIAETKEKRDKLQSDISELAKQRDAYLKQEVAKRGGEKDSFDAKIYSSIRGQAEGKGLVFNEESMKY